MRLFSWEATKSVPLTHVPDALRQQQSNHCRVSESARLVQCVVAEFICLIHLSDYQFRVLSVHELFSKQHLDDFLLVVLDGEHEWRPFVFLLCHERRDAEIRDDVVHHIDVASCAGPQHVPICNPLRVVLL